MRAGWVVTVLPVRFPWVLILALGCLALPASAGHLGVYGNTWEVAEPDMLDALMVKLRAMEKAGKLKQLEQEAKRQTLDSIERPKPIPGIATASRSRKWTFDPSIRVVETIKDHLGNIIAPAGMVVNPLAYTSLTKPLLFIDARDKRQVAYARAFSDREPRAKVILVGGSWLDLTRSWKRQVYYDQAGFITSRFGIRHVPAVVRQQGKVLKIEELAI
ncbi:MAG: type-F conjugative transfer system protein TraW [Gammaproteobacteria bacterium]|nr:type-F conjugative transfer system protein TraW [Gammaproteobacteria bacterium]